MKKLLVFLVLTTISMLTSIAQKGITYACANDEGKFGIRDKNTKKWIIKPQYTWIDNFENNGLARVYVGGKLDDRGEITLSKTSHPMVSDGKWGFINQKGKMVIQPEIDFTYSFDQNERAIINNGITFAEDTENDGEMCYCFYPDKPGKWGMINAQGKVIIPLLYDKLIPLAKNHI